MAFPNVGQTVASAQVGMRGAQKPMRRVQTPTAQANARPGAGALPLMGGGGMAVGPMRGPAGVPRNPLGARKALLAGLKG